MHRSRPSGTPTLVCTVAVAGLLLAACRDEAARPEQQPARPTAAAPAIRQQAAKSPLKQEAEECDPPVAHYRFGSAEPQPGSARALHEFVSCLRRSGKTEQTLTVIGRTDARGSVGYNQRLAAKRAERVRDLLVEGGLDARRIVVRSTGERGALGALEGHAHAQDRRVDIFVSDERVTTN